MDVFSRALRRRDPMRFAALAVGASWVALLSAFGFAATSVTPSVAGGVAAAGAFLVAGAAILYAWREPGR